MGVEPDSVSDWWNVGVNAATAIATVAAVWFSVITARRARADQRVEADRRREAEMRLLAEQQADAAERLRAAAELREVQLEAEAKEARDRRNAEVARMAERQAVFVRSRGRWSQPEEGVSGDLHAVIGVEILNDSDAPITEVSFLFDRTFGVFGPATQKTDMDRTEFSIPVDVIFAKSAYTSRDNMTYVWGHSTGDDLGFVVRFTDCYRDQWEISPNGALHLIDPRRITAYDA